MKSFCKHICRVFGALAMLAVALPSWAGQPKDTVTQLDEIVVTRKRQKYSKKNNPAVDLLRKIRSAMGSHDPKKRDAYTYDKYERMTIALNNFDKEKSQWLSKRLDPIEDFVDTAHITGSPVLNLSVREKAARDYYRDGRHKQVVEGFRSNGIDDQFNQENINVMLEDVFREIDIFGADINIMQNRFVSPLAPIAADYYKYSLGDTTLIDGTRCVELIFVPHNPESFSFNGSIYVAEGDSTMFIKRLTMRIPKALNLNFVKNIFVEQDFEKDEEGYRHKVSDDMSVELQLMPGIQGFYTRRNTKYSNFGYQAPGDFETVMSYGREDYYVPGFDKRDGAFWTESPYARIAPAEKNMASITERMERVPLFKWIRRGVQLLVTGYIPTGNPSKFGIGPVNTMISANSIEGARFRLGGMSTAALSKRFFFRGYGAYGTKDHRWKYGGEVEYSFVDKKNHSREFPMNSIRLEHQYDIDMIGQHYLFTNADNVFLSLKRMENTLGVYRRQTKATYFLETLSGWSLSAGIKAERMESTRWLPFVDGHGKVFGHYNQSAFFAEVTFAPEAKFVQTNSYRLPVNMDNWVVTLSHEYGPSGFLGSQFTVNKTEASVRKRFWFSSFGYVDIYLKGGKVWSSVPYPSLPWPNANLSYTIQPESYPLMNPMEFAADTYGAWDVTYWLNGFIFNRIPVVRELKFREVVSFRGYAGHLSSRNDPSLHPDLLRFPTDSFAKPMGSTPYMEIGAGIDNIFSILRVDYVWRLSYRNTPDAPNSGLRIALHFAF